MTPHRWYFPDTDNQMAEKCRIYLSGEISIPNATDTTVNFDRDKFDPNDMHDIVTDNEKIVCNTAGVYLIMASVEWDNSNAGYRRITLYNESTLVCRNSMMFVQGAKEVMSVFGLWEITAGESFHLKVYHTHGSARNLKSGASTFMAVFRIL